MDMVGEQSKRCLFIDVHRQNIEKDKIRIQRGNVLRKRLHVLSNLTKLVFRGWKEVLKLWTYADCKE
jgi:hypothetical protein